MVPCCVLCCALLCCGAVMCSVMWYGSTKSWKRFCLEHWHSFPHDTEAYRVFLSLLKCQKKSFLFCLNRYATFFLELSPNLTRPWPNRYNYYQKMFAIKWYKPAKECKAQLYFVAVSFSTGRVRSGPQTQSPEQRKRTRHQSLLATSLVFATVHVRTKEKLFCITYPALLPLSLVLCLL